MPQMHLTCIPFPKARFLTGTEKELGSSTSSDTEEDPLPANKCKKVCGPDPAVPSAWVSAWSWGEDKCTASEKWAALGLGHGVGTLSPCCYGIGLPGDVAPRSCPECSEMGIRTPGSLGLIPLIHEWLY